VPRIRWTKLVAERCYNTEQEDVMADADRNDPESRLALFLLRHNQYWDQKQLAQAARISPSQLSVYERGERPMPRDVLEKVAVAAGFPVYLLDPLLTGLRSFRAAARGGSRPARVVGELLALEMMRLAQKVVEEVLDSVAGTGYPAMALDAESLWARLEDCTASERRVLVEELEEYWSADLCGWVIGESTRKAADDPQEALNLAELALLIAERVPGERTSTLGLQGYAWAHLAKARRTAGDSTGADEALARARDLGCSGASSDPSWLACLSGAVSCEGRDSPCEGESPS
jgi:transcriptional regulator with XRE-family HTH domain